MVSVPECQKFSSTKPWRAACRPCPSSFPWHRPPQIALPGALLFENTPGAPDHDAQTFYHQLKLIQSHTFFSITASLIFQMDSILVQSFQKSSQPLGSGMSLRSTELLLFSKGPGALSPSPPRLINPGGPPPLPLC